MLDIYSITVWLNAANRDDPTEILIGHTVIFGPDASLEIKGVHHEKHFPAGTWGEVRVFPRKGTS